VKRYGILSTAGRAEAEALIDVTLGREKADLAVIGGTVLNVYTGELQEDHAVLIKGEWIAYVGDDPGGSIGPSTQVIDAKGKVLIPGLIDGHAHLADFLSGPVEFLRQAMTGGTTTIITETIEPYPVMGDGGVTDFLDSLKDQPIKVFATAPAMASTSRASHGVPRETLKKLLLRDDVIGLGESFWQSVLQDPDTFLPNFMETLSAGKKLEGHSAGAKGRALMAYIAFGISSCHEPITAGEALERLRLGIHVMVREGSIRRDLAAISELKGAGIDLRRLILVTDGVGPQDLLEKGYMEYVVQKAIDAGFDPAEAVQMATVNVAEYFSLDGLIGGIAPGRHADLLILPDPGTIRAEVVLSRGRVIAREGRLLAPPREHAFPREALQSVHLPGELSPSDFAITAEEGLSSVKVRVIDQVTDLVTREFVTSLPVIDGEIRTDPGGDFLKVAAIDRRFSPGKIFVGLIRGFRMKTGAFACSSAWDTSDIIVVGENEEDMAAAVNRIHAVQGGAVLCAGGEILAEIPLPVFGLMADMPVAEVAERVEGLNRSMKEMGFPFNDPYRTLVTLTGAAIPFLRICDDGLVDIKTGKTVSLFVD
jgi:adenine deaminase